MSRYKSNLMLFLSLSFLLFIFNGKAVAAFTDVDFFNTTRQAIMEQLIKDKTIRPNSNKTIPQIEPIKIPLVRTIPHKAVKGFRGVLLDTKGTPISGAYLTQINGANISVVSNENGLFLFSNTLFGDAIIEVKKEGKFPFYISPHESADANITNKTFIMYSHSLVGLNSGISVIADRIDYNHNANIVFASGNVSAQDRSGKGELKAKKIAFNTATNIASASGEVKISNGKDIISGDSFEISVSNFTGNVSSASMFFTEGHYYIDAGVINKVGEVSYQAKDAKVTTCDGDCPDWYILADEAGITANGYGTAQNAMFYAGDIPVFYLPYLVFPAKNTRQVGLLAPQISYSKDKLGVDVEVPFYIPLSENTDATLYHRQMSNRGAKEGGEFRYAVSDNVYGVMYFDSFRDTKSNGMGDSITNGQYAIPQSRWSLYMNHVVKLDDGFYLRADIAKVSDNWYFSDFSSHNYYRDNYARNPNDKFRAVPFTADETISSLDSTVRVVKNWGKYSFTGVVKYTDDLTQESNNNTIQKYP
ncbi:MAG: hypothetical protein WCJ49_05755, partial [Deltaproteobacteria bacterium]